MKLIILGPFEKAKLLYILYYIIKKNRSDQFNELWTNITTGKVVGAPM